MNKKVIYEVRRNSRYCARFSSLEEAIEAIQSDCYPCENYGKFTIVKIETEVVRIFDFTIAPEYN